jgi:hypothetical protein
MPSSARPTEPFPGGSFPASVLREPSPTATCTCVHWIHCDHACHGRDCDPSESACDIAFLPDEGGLTLWGCAACTPGEGMPHVLGCELMAPIDSAPPAVH